MKKVKAFLKHLMTIDNCIREARDIFFDNQGIEKEKYTIEELQKLKELFTTIISSKKKMNRDYSEESSILNEIQMKIDSKIFE